MLPRSCVIHSCVTTVCVTYVHVPAGLVSNVHVFTVLAIRPAVTPLMESICLYHVLFLLMGDQLEPFSKFQFWRSSISPNWSYLTGLAGHNCPVLSLVMLEYAPSTPQKNTFICHRAENNKKRSPQSIFSEGTLCPIRAGLNVVFAADQFPRSNLDDRAKR